MSAVRGGKSDPGRRALAGIAGSGPPHAGSTRRRASAGRLTCRESATCVHGPGHCGPPAGKPGSSSAPGYGSSSGAVRSTPADRINFQQKIFCCVTTRRRNLGIGRGLRRGLGPLAAHPLRLGVPGFGLGCRAPAGLSSRRLPASDLPKALRLLAVPLVPAPRLIPAPAPLPQAEPQSRSPYSGTAMRL